MSLRSLKSLAETLRSEPWIDTTPNFFGSTLQLTWGEPAKLSMAEDVKPSMRENSKEWGGLWNQLDDSDFDKAVGNLYLNLGSLGKDGRSSIRLTTTGDDDLYFLPNSASIQVGAVCPYLLKFDEELPCAGFMSLQFSGEGYLCWMELDEIADRLDRSEMINRAKRVCREAFPVPQDGRLDQLRETFGDMFLNRDSYVSGDWILTIEETG
ncbi:MAG: hypothetical protein KDN22_15975 [Verrucomicrobiae bacterium]|nr:hypothetical protein [Verrucomicrobiae bacterium]